MHSEMFILTLNIFKKKKMLEKHETLMRQKNNWKTDWYFDSIYPFVGLIMLLIYTTK